MSNEEKQPADFIKKLKKLHLPEFEEERLRIFQFNDQKGEYEELEVQEGVPLYELLDPDFILLFVDPEHYRVWIWHGANTTTRMKFIAAKIAPKIRDRYGIAYKITAVDEGQETKAFKITSGIEKEIDYEKEQTGPAYEGTAEDDELIKELSREKIVLLLEKAGIPEGYERKMVIVKNKIYGYKEFDQNYMGSVIKEKKLYPLKEQVPDGPYLAENYVPRILFSFNNVVITELLQRIETGDTNN
ncbi:MAG: hypothetical protein ACFFD2_29830 [Promethearchaeota archaeon]